MSFLSRLLNRALSTSQLPTAANETAAAVEISLSKKIFKERNLKCLVEKFKKFSENDRFRTKASVYENTVKRLAKAKRYKWIEEILEDQKNYFDIQKEGFNARLISLYGQSKMFDHARKVFDEMPERNCQRTVMSFNALLSACVDSKKFDQVIGLFKELPLELKIEPDVISYNIVIKAFCRMGDLNKAKSMLAEMEMNGMSPNMFAFTSLLHGFYSNGMFVEGEQIWSRMEECIVPDIMSYNSKLHGLALHKRVEEFVPLLDEMKSRGIKLDLISFNSLIRGFIEVENFEQAKHWYCQLKDNGVHRPNILTYTMLIPFACKKGDFEFAFELSKDVIARNFRVDAALLQEVVDGLVKDAKNKDAEELVKLGGNNGYCRYKLKLPA